MQAICNKNAVISQYSNSDIFKGCIPLGCIHPIGELANCPVAWPKMNLFSVRIRGGRNGRFSVSLFLLMYSRTLPRSCFSISPSLLDWTTGALEAAKLLHNKAHVASNVCTGSWISVPAVTHNITEFLTCRAQHPFEEELLMHGMLTAP